MATTYSTNLSDLLDPSFKEIMDLDWAIPMEYTQVLKTMNTDRESTKFSAIAGIGAAQQNLEGDTINSSLIRQGFDVTATQIGYAAGVELHDDLVKFDLYGNAKDAFRHVSRSMRVATETNAAKLFNEAFATSRTGGDGAALLSSAHLREDGGPNENNILGTASDLDITAYRDAWIDFMDMRDGNGDRINLAPTKLITPNATNSFIAKEILKSTDRPDTTNRATNIHQGEVQHVIWSYLTDADSWYFTSPEMNVYVLWSQQPDKKTDYDVRNRVSIFNSRMLLALFWKDWRGVYGTPGA